MKPQQYKVSVTFPQHDQLEKKHNLPAACHILNLNKQHSGQELISKALKALEW